MAKGSRGLKRKLASQNGKKQKVTSTNPFEQRQNKRLRQEVIGRRLKGARRNVALARSKGEERRNNTLLKEFKNSKKSNSFVDRFSLLFVFD